MESKTMVFTGGGSAGHVTPNIALMRRLSSEGVKIHYIGTEKGIERGIVNNERYITYHSVSAGKLRRYFSLENAKDVFRVLRGIGQARRIIKKIKPDAVFSKGGYVSVPVVIGAKRYCPVIAHESDYSQGLSTRIANRYACAVCVTFEDSLARVGSKGVFTGTPIRGELYNGSRERGYSFTGFNEDKPILMMMGGSLGAASINDVLRLSLDGLLPHFNIIHLTGKDKLDESINRPGYKQYEFINEELPDLFAIADIILARSGANAIFEFLALKKPALLIPLPLSASRGDQIQNASYFKKKGFADVLSQDDLTPQTLTSALIALYKNRARYIAAMDAAPNIDGTDAVLNVIRGYLHNG